MVSTRAERREGGEWFEAIGATAVIEAYVPAISAPGFVYAREAVVKTVRYLSRPAFSRANDSRTDSVVPPTPMRNRSGYSKKRPGTTEVSKGDIRRSRRGNSVTWRGALCHLTY